jgi:serine/threonine protein kinase/tetratricopeptide (TPR) repeat protein
MADAVDRTAAPGDPSVEESAPPAAPGILARGTAIRRYVVLDPIGAGAMGVVYAAYDRDLDRRVALKLVRDPQRGSARQRLLREAQALAQLSHPNVVTVFDVGTFGDQVFVAMELVAGQTLRSWLAAAPRGQREVVEVYRRAGEGLAAAHAAGIIHRDFKPDNALIDERGRVRVADFGLALIERGADSARSSRDRGRGDRGRAEPDRDDPADAAEPSGDGDTHLGAPPGLTAAGVVLGTPAYMAPEQRAGFAPVDARADQFSFCVALHEALVGHRPFEVAETAAAPSDQPGAAPTPSGALEPAALTPSGARLDPAMFTPSGAHVGAASSAPSASRSAELDRPRSVSAVEPSSVASGLPARIARVLARGMASDPADRYPSMAALLADLAPARKRRRNAVAALAAGGVALVASIAFGARAFQREVEPPCRGAAAALSGTWDGARKQALRAAFEGTGSPLAAGAWARVEPAVDRWASGWVAARTDACEATHVRREQSATLLDLRMDCLDHRRDELRALVDLLVAEADPEAVARSIDAASSLPSLAACADRTALSEEVRPSAAQAPKVAALRERLAWIEARVRTADYRDALEPAGKLVDDAIALGFRPLEAEALLYRGRLERRTGDMAAAEETLYRALAAGQAGRAARLTVETWLELAWMIGVQLLRREEGYRVAGLARGALDRLGPDDALESELEGIVGTLDRDRGKLAEARPRLQRSLALAEKGSAPDSQAVREAIKRLAILAGMEGDKPGALRLHRQARELAERALGPGHPALVGYLVNEATALAELGQLDESLVLNRRALAMSEGANGPVSDNAGRLRNNIGLLLQMKGDHRGALTELDTALAVKSKLYGPDYPGLAEPYLNSGLTLVELARFSEAIERFQRAAALYERAGGPDHPDLAQALTAIGEAHLAAASPEPAIAPLERAVAIRDKGEANAVEAAQARYLLAQALWASRPRRGRDRPRALRLAAAASAGFAAEGDSEAADEVSNWIKHRH